MQNPIFKLTALAAVIGIGFLVVFQAQKGMSHLGSGVDPKEAFETLADPSVPSDAADGSTQPEGAGDAPPPSQFEPTPATTVSAGKAKPADDMFGPEPAQPDANSNAGISFQENTPPEAAKQPFEPHLASSETSFTKIPPKEDAPAPPQDNPFASKSTPEKPAAGNADEKTAADSSQPFDPTALDAKPEIAATKKSLEPSLIDDAVQPAGFDAPPADAKPTAVTGKEPESEKAAPSGGPQLFSFDPEPASAAKSDAAKEQPEPLHADSKPALKAVPQKGVRTASNESPADAFEPAAADPFAQSAPAKKVDDEPLLLDDEKPAPSQSKEPEAKEPETKPIKAPTLSDPPSLNDAPSFDAPSKTPEKQDDLKLDEPTPAAKDSNTPQLVPQEDAFPSAEPAKNKVKSPELPSLDHDPFGADKSEKAVPSQAKEPPATPTLEKNDLFGQDEKKSPEQVDKLDERSPASPAPILAPPEDSGRVKISPDEPAPLGDRIEKSEPVPSKSIDDPAPSLKSVPQVEDATSEVPPTRPATKFKSTTPKNKLPVIRPRALGRRPNPTPEESNDAAGDAPAAEENSTGAGQPEQSEPAESSRDVFNGDGTVHDNAPQGPQQPRLVLTKTAPPNAAIGQPLIYSILVRNVGDSPAREVVVQDRIPRGTQLKGTIPQAELIDRRLVWKLGTMDPGASKKISIRVIPTEEGTVGSVATVTFAAEVASKTVITAAKISVGMSGPESASVGENVTFRFKVINRGNAHATNVVLRDILPEGLKHAAGKELEFAVGNLAIGESRDIDLVLTAAETGDMVNRAVVTTADGASVEAKASIKIEEPQLVLSRTGPKQRYAGREASFTNTVANRGRTPVAGVTVVESVPPGMDFVEASEGGQFNPAKRSVAWRIHEIAPGESRELHVKLISKETGKMTSTVVAFDQRGNKVEATSETNVAGFATVSLDVSEVPGAVEIGETVKLKIVLGNRGTTQANNVVLRLTVPEELELASIEGPAKYARAGDHVEFAPIPVVDANGNSAFEVAFKARKAGDVRLGLQVSAEQLTKPLVREEAILILGEGQ